MKASRGTRRHSIFVGPLWLGIVSLVGLVVGLLGDDVLDLLAWLALGVPVAAIGWALIARRA